jgi:signal peptidase II
LAVGIWLLGLAADQLAKLSALEHLEVGQGVQVLGPALRFTLIFNPGAAFGMGEDATVVFSVFAIVATVVCLFVVLPRIRRVWHGLALGLLLAGITGNLYDRLFQPPSFMHGHVVDFIQVPYFAIFNVADICITVAAGLIILATFLWDEDRDRKKLEAAA